MSNLKIEKSSSRIYKSFPNKHFKKYSQQFPMEKNIKQNPQSESYPFFQCRRQFPRGWYSLQQKNE